MLSLCISKSCLIYFVGKQGSMYPRRPCWRQFDRLQRISAITLHLPRNLHQKINITVHFERQQFWLDKRLFIAQNDIINTACGVLSLEKDSLQAISCKDLRHAERRVTKVYVKLIPIIWNPLQNALPLFENITGFDFIDSTQEQFSARLLGLASTQAIGQACMRAGPSTVLSGCLANGPNVRRCARCEDFLKGSCSLRLGRKHAPVSGETRQTLQISAETVNPVTQHEEGEGTN